MFEINKYNTKDENFWLKIIKTKSTIVLTPIKEDKTIDIRIFNEKTIYQNSFEIKKKKDISYEGELSVDGNEYDLKIKSKEKVILFLNFYFSLDSSLIISIVEEGNRREITTIPNALL